MRSELEIIQMEVGLLQNFCEVIGCPETGDAALVDPAFEVDRLLAVVREREWTVRTILLTHTHDDHVAGLDEAAEATGAVVRCHPMEVERARAFAPRVEPVSDGEEVTIGAGVARAVFTPGHTPGCVCWYLPQPGAVITGDVLFVGSCGGVHYPDSDSVAMVHSLQNRLGALPEETKLYPGHDYGKTPTSTLLWERLHNPALTNDTLDDFRRYKKVR
ncbi:MBL fold metallo-hydrolase [Haliangium sp.]|uniref:MBL fold metallo-hydrolase n=1 Tax=Haliangium sp. TaxID=2663208 RepID=UPI003D0A55FC